MLKSFLDATLLEAGCDEAGRGCLAGPVFAAAVILPKDFSHPLLRDSKELKEEERYDARVIIEREAIAWAVARAEAKEIDKINILNASFLAMHRAIGQLDTLPQSLLIDGNRFKPYRNIPFHCIIQGDGKMCSIAAASILAKTYRDDYMMEIDRDYPYYLWYKNKGYGTPEHRTAIIAHGLSPHHRRSFRMLPDKLQRKLF